MNAEIHTAGVVVQSLPERSLEAAAAITILPNVEVRAIDAGKLVVICEGGSTKETLDLIDHLRTLPGVVNVALVYQHSESAAGMNEERGDETAAPRIH
ncbi:MAG: chaperone NapD [Betaproteobacteria bacterium]